MLVLFNMTWQVLTSISILTTSAATLLQRVLTKKESSDPYAYSVLFQLLIGLGILFFAAMQLTDNSSKVASFAVFGIIITVILSMIFLKERNNLPQKLAGAVLSFMGLLLI